MRLGMGEINRLQIMDIQIRYANELGSPITMQQQQLLNNYQKLTYVSNQLKMVENIRFLDNVIYKVVKYFLDSAEDKTTILDEYTNANTETSCILYFNMQSVPGFSLWDWEDYSETAQLAFKGKAVFDDKNRLVMSCSFDLLTNALRPGALKNYYSDYTGDENADNLLQFEYDSDGEVDLVFDVQGKFSYIEGITLGTYLQDTVFSEVDFPWDEHPYYHSIIPYLPTGNL
jgi:hypothetical protein